MDHAGHALLVGMTSSMDRLYRRRQLLAALTVLMVENHLEAPWNIRMWNDSQCSDYEHASEVDVSFDLMADFDAWVTALGAPDPVKRVELNGDSCGHVNMVFYGFRMRIDVIEEGPTREALGADAIEGVRALAMEEPTLDEVPLEPADLPREGPRFLPL